jgi:lipopolysaccharide export system protein LptA
MSKALRVMFLAAALALPALSLPAQEAGLSFGGLKQDTGLPVEVTADQLAVSQTDGTALFSGNVLVVQGAMRLKAAEVLVEYDATGKAIARLLASGGVTLVNPTDAAEAREAVYSIADGTLEMTGDVLLTQGAGALSGQRLLIDLRTGTGRMEGRVRTVFQPGGGN